MSNSPYRYSPRNPYPFAEPKLGPREDASPSGSALGRLRLKSTLHWKEPVPEERHRFADQYVSYDMTSVEAWREHDALRQHGLDVQRVPHRSGYFVLTVAKDVAENWAAPRPQPQHSR